VAQGSPTTTKRRIVLTSLTQEILGLYQAILVLKDSFFLSNKQLD
jgi:hypothetical protein